MSNESNSARNNRGQPVRVAIACPGVGLVQRGFERMFDDLFRLLEQDLDITLYKGGGTGSARQKKLWFFSRNGFIVKWFPLHRLLGRTSIHVECFTFALSLLLAIRGKDYDVIHCIDPPLTRILYKLRKRFDLNFRLLYTEGCAMPPGHYPPADHTQQVSQVTYDEALAHGIPADYMTVIPPGIYSERFAVNATRAELRRKLSIADDTFVVLCLAAINRVHKRIDYLIDEFSGVRGNVMLWIDGSLDQGDPGLIRYARDKLGERCRITHIPSRQVGELFVVADLMVHASLFESFGLGLVEAASCGLPVLTHNADHFRWLINNENCAIDMSKQGELTARLNEIVENRQRLASMENQAEVLGRYRWEVLKDDYLGLYETVAKLPADEIGVAHRYGLK